jgi:cardiolipin synthase
MPDGTRPLRAAPAAGAINIANAVTLARLCIVPAAVWLVLRDHAMLAFWLFLSAGLSDAVDGWLARRRGPSAVGALLDPVADKVLLVSMYVTLAAVHVLPDWLAILVVFRDVVIVGGVLGLSVLGLPVVIRPLMVSKVNTVLQIVLVAVALLQSGLGHPTSVLPVLVWLVAASTFASGAAYVAHAARTR